MAIPFIPMLFAGLLKGAGSAFGAASAESANKRNATGAALRRQGFLKLIEKINNRDLSGLDAQASDVFSRASDQIDASAAARGVRRAPNAGASRAQSEAFSQVLANLAQARAEDQRQAQSLEANIRSDESFGVPDPSTFDPTRAGLLAGLGGFAGGAGETLGNFLGTDAGLAFLNGPQLPELTASQRAFGRRYQNRNMGR